MDAAQIKKVVTIYKQYFVSKKIIEPIQHPSAPLCGHHLDVMSHLLFMCEEILNDKVEGEKAHRWLGFIQGYFWLYKHNTLDQLKAHNASPISTEVPIEVPIELSEVDFLNEDSNAVQN